MLSPVFHRFRASSLALGRPIPLAESLPQPQMLQSRMIHLRQTVASKCPRFEPQCCHSSRRQPAPAVVACLPCDQRFPGWHSAWYRSYSLDSVRSFHNALIATSAPVLPSKSLSTICRSAIDIFVARGLTCRIARYSRLPLGRDTYANRTPRFFFRPDEGSRCWFSLVQAVSLEGFETSLSSCPTGIRMRRGEENRKRD